jgi:hypothetical protein
VSAQPEEVTQAKIQLNEAEVLEGLKMGFEYALSLEPKPRSALNRFMAKVTGLHRAFEAQDNREHSSLLPRYIEEINSTIDNKGEEAVNGK